jgi:hypothetical protein
MLPFIFWLTVLRRFALRVCRYLLKLRAEVEVMQQLGLSLNAVHLHDVFEVSCDAHRGAGRRGDQCGWDKAEGGVQRWA